MSKPKLRRIGQQTGFTFVEVAVVAPIIILLIGAFITIIVNMTSEVIRSRGSSQLAYNVQDAINRIDQDVKLSVGFLAENNFDLESPQGINDGTEKFVNVGDDGNVLIINALATTGNPLDSTSGVAFLENRPNACGNQQGQNTPLTFNIVYFVKDDALWRRVVMPSDYDSTACNASGTDTAAPWQRPSCAVGYSNPFCKTEDEKLVEGVSSEDFVITYYNAANSSTANTTASNTDASVDDRNIALRSVGNVGISINASRVAAGQEISQSSSLRATRLDTNASTVAEPVVVTAPSTPVVSGTYQAPKTGKFSWPASSGNGTITYSLDYRIDNGSWQTGLTNSTSRSYDVEPSYNGAEIDVRVRATNSEGTSSYGNYTLTIPVWVPLLLQNNWSNYDNTYTFPAYTMTKDGVVVVKGMVKRSGTAVGEEVIATLPAGYRPSFSLMFGGSTNPNASSRIDVNNDGNIERASGSEGWFSLDTIRFVPDGRYTRTSTTPVNGWTNYGGEWAPGSYVQVDDGRIFTQGLMRSGTWTNGTQIFDIPDPLLPSLYMHIAGRSNGWGYMGVENRTVAAQGILAKATGNTYLSVNASYYPASYTSWTNLSLVNSWVWYGSIFSTPQYTKSPSDNMVSLKGLIGSGSTSAGSTITTLPVGFRPKERILFTTVAADAYCRIDIQPNGIVTNQSGCSNVWLSLDGVTFLAEQ